MKGFYSKAVKEVFEFSVLAFHTRKFIPKLLFFNCFPKRGLGGGIFV